MTIPYIVENKNCSKPPTRIINQVGLLNTGNAMAGFGGEWRVVSPLGAEHVFWSNTEYISPRFQYTIQNQYIWWIPVIWSNTEYTIIFQDSILVWAVMGVPVMIVYFFPFLSRNTHDSSYQSLHYYILGDFPILTQYYRGPSKENAEQYFQGSNLLIYDWGLWKRRKGLLGRFSHLVNTVS